jgi:hypothetical protein
MSAPRRVLLKTTIGPVSDDWHIGRFSRLAAHLASLEGFEITARDRAADATGDDPDFAAAANGAYDQVWLFAVDVTGALTAGDVERLDAFRRAGGALLLTRDHQDLGSCITRLGPLGATQHFQSANPEEDAARRTIDDTDTPTITWPNYHSGANGDAQTIRVAQPLHPLMRRPDGAPLAFLPAHPHEGAVGVPAALRSTAQVVAEGHSLKTGAAFNICVAVEEPGLGRAVSDSSFHHFADYNWDPRLGAPTFVDEPPGDAMITNPQKAADARQYAANIALWLAGKL